MRKKTAQADRYAAQLLALLDAAQTAAGNCHPDGSLDVVELLFQQLSELCSERMHLHQDLVVAKLAAVAAAPWAFILAQEHAPGGDKGRCLRGFGVGRGEGGLKRESESMPSSLYALESLCVCQTRIKNIALISILLFIQ